MVRKGREGSNPSPGAIITFSFCTEMDIPYSPIVLRIAIAKMNREVLNTRANAKYLVRIEHPVPDFSAWKKAFDSDPVSREKLRVRRYEILRPIDDPKYVMVDLEFDTSNDAEAFRSAIIDLWRSAEAKEIIAKPQARVVEAVENKEL